MIYHSFSSSLVSKRVAAVALVWLALACPGQTTGETANDFRTRGNQALADGIYSAAVRFFTRYRQAVGLKEPGLSDATALLMEAFYREGKFSEAAAALAWYNEKSPGVEDPYYKDLILYWQAAVMLKTGKTREPLAVVDQLLKRHSEADDIRVAALVLKGDIHARLRQWPDAEQAFKTVITEFSKDPADQQHVTRAKLGLADVLKQSGRTEDAITLLTQLAADPSLPAATRTQAQLQMISVYISRNEIKKALTLYTTIEPQRPRIANAVWYARTSELFNALAKNDSPDLALRLIPGLTETAPDAESRLSIRVEACKLLMAAGRLKDAQDQLATLAAAPATNLPTIAALQLKLTELYGEKGQNDLRIDLLRQIIDQQEIAKNIRFKAASKLGTALTSKEDFDGGAKAFIEAARLAGTRAQQAQALYSAGDASLKKAEKTDTDAASQRLDYSKAANFFKNVADNYPETTLAPTAVFKLALTKARTNAYTEAADILKPFLKKYPENTFWDQAALLRIRSLRKAGEKEKTTQAVNDFITRKPDSELAPAALMEGFEAARQAGDYPQCNGFLSAIIDRENEYASSGLPPHALYERVHLNFLYGKTETALADCETFFEKYSQLPLAADVHLWQGDYYLSLARQQTENGASNPQSPLYTQALKAYMNAISQHPRTEAAKRALFEAARIHYYLKDFSQARDNLTRLIALLPADSPSRMLGMAYIQMGDVQSEAGDYQAALEAFQKGRKNLLPTDNDLEVLKKARENPSSPDIDLEAVKKARENLSASDIDIVTTSMGREADMWISLAGAEEDGSQNRRNHLSKAGDLLENVVIMAPPSSETLAEAQFKLGKTWEMRGDDEQAIENYLNVSYGYEEAVKNGAICDWHYYPRAVFAAGEILERQGNYEQALRCYQRLAQSNLPTAPEAVAKVQKIKDLTRR